MHTRDDHVVTVHYPDGTMVVEHADGTRITTVMQDVSTVANTADAPETGSYKKLRHRRGTARRALSVEILSTAAELYDKSLLEGLQ